MFGVSDALDSAKAKAKWAHESVKEDALEEQDDVESTNQQTNNEHNEQINCDNAAHAALRLVRHVPAPPHAGAAKVVPPANFAMVEAGVYRSGKPSKHSLPFLQKLNLASIIYLSSANDSDSNLRFASQNNVKYLQFRVDENKEPFKQIDQAELAKALVEMLDVRNHPMLMYSDRGKHRIGCIVGCLRKLQKWSLASIFDEYQRFSGSKIYIADQEFIEIFSAPVRYNPEYAPKWIYHS